MVTSQRASLVLASALLLAAPARSQDVEITPFIGYEAGGSFGVARDAFPLREARVEGDASYGVGVGIRLGPGYGLKFIYSRQETELAVPGAEAFGTPPPTGLFPVTGKLFDVSVSHFHGGLEWDFGEDDVVRPFIEGLIGASLFDPDSSDRSEEWFFSGGIGGGVKLFFSRHVGLCLKARYIPIVVRSDEATFCTLPGGCFVAFDQEYLSRGEASVGLTFRF